MKTKFKEFWQSGQREELNSIKRWNGKDTVKEESVGEHTFSVVQNVAIMCMGLFNPSYTDVVALQRDALMYAVFHDVDEVLTGDIGHELKYNNFNGEEIRQAIDAYVKQQVAAKYDIEFVGDEMKRFILMEHKRFGGIVKKLVKVADWTSMRSYCEREYKTFSNQSFKKLFEYCHLQYIKSLQVLEQNLDSSLFKQRYSKEFLSQLYI